MMNKFIWTICLISFVICFGGASQSNAHGFYFLPLALLMFSFIESTMLTNISKSYVYFIFYFQAIIRYCLIPIGMTNGSELLARGSYYNIDVAIYIMCIELFFIFIVFIYNNYRFNEFDGRNCIVLVNRSYLLYFFIALFFFIVVFSGFLGKINFIWNLNDYVQQKAVDGEEVENSSIGALLFIPLKVIVLLIAGSWILKSKKIKNKTLYLLIIMGVSSSFIVGVSRLSILTFILPFYLLLNSILPKKSKKMINIGLACIVLPVLLITSIAKFSRGNSSDASETIFNTNSLNAYFAGPGNVAVGIDAFEGQKNKEYGLFFLNDIFQNVPIISKFTVSKYKSNMVFNKQVYGHSLWQTQIVPLSIAGLFHFDYFGVGVYSAIILSIAFYFEKKAKIEEYLPYKYVFFSLTLTLSLIFMLNIGSMVVTVIRSLIFVYLPFYITRNTK